jgi:hypothetical protein
MRAAAPCHAMIACSCAQHPGRIYSGGHDDLAKAAIVYAKQSKDKRMLANATAIRRRAVRRYGQIMEEQRKAGALAKQKGVKGSKGFPKTPAALAKQGIDKNLANSARKRANTPSRSAED